MFKGLGNLAGIAAQAQQMSARVQEMQERMNREQVTGSAGGGMVEVEMSGAQRVLSVRIDPGLVERNEREMIEDLVAAATNDAADKAKQLHAEAMQEITGGMNLPGMVDMLSKFTGGGDQQ